jgi:DNA-binding FrmR family transcriptional regulator
MKPVRQQPDGFFFGFQTTPAEFKTAGTEGGALLSRECRPTVCNIRIPRICILMLQNTRESIRRRTNRIAGQIAGIQRMIEEDRYCVDILNQISAVRSALDSLGVELLTSHLQTCIIGQDSKHPKAKPMQPSELVNELHQVLSGFLK